MTRFSTPAKLAGNELRGSPRGRTGPHPRDHEEQNTIDSHTAKTWHTIKTWLGHRYALIPGALLIFSVFLWLIGLISFARGLPASPAAPEAADGIIVLTGGEARLSEAVNLLRQQKGKRLLISGVNPMASKEDIRVLINGSQELFACCVDLDRTAANTLGNAIQSAAWVEEHGYRSIIVVTANYHMPRSLLEFRRAMPDVDIIPYPVQSDRVRVSDWWSRFGTARFIASEYNKYLASLLRSTFLPASN